MIQIYQHNFITLMILNSVILFARMDTIQIKILYNVKNVILFVKLVAYYQIIVQVAIVIQQLIPI